MPEEKYTIIPKEEAVQLKRDALFSFGSVRLGPSYTDGTVKVWIKKIPSLPEEPEKWEANRQKYLSAGQTDSRMALEGICYGYLPYDLPETPLHACKDGDEFFIYGRSYQLYDIEIDYFESLIDEDLRIRSSVEDKLRTEEWCETRMNKFSKEWEESSSKSINGLLRRLNNIGLASRGQKLSNEDKWDYAGHIIGLHNTGCTYFESETQNLRFERSLTLNYVTEHFERHLMSPDVAVEIFKKIDLAPKRIDLRVIDEKEKFVFQVIENNLERLRKEREERLKKEQYIRETFSAVFDAFGQNCKIRFE